MGWATSRRMVPEPELEDLASSSQNIPPVYYTHIRICSEVLDAIKEHSPGRGG